MSDSSGGDEDLVSAPLPSTPGFETMIQPTFFLRNSLRWVCVALAFLLVGPPRADANDSDAAYAYAEPDDVDMGYVEVSQPAIGCDAAWLGDAGCHGECHGVDRDPGRPQKPCLTMPGDRDRGDCPPLRYRMCDEKRTGHADKVAPWAICARPNTRFGRYTAWFVGGGAAFSKVPQLPIPLLSRGRQRHANGCGQHGEGTWGLDYEGFAGRAKVWLEYTDGRNQGGEGAYATDGEPKLIAKIKDRLHH